MHSKLYFVRQNEVTRVFVCWKAYWLLDTQKVCDQQDVFNGVNIKTKSVFRNNFLNFLFFLSNIAKIFETFFQKSKTVKNEMFSIKPVYNVKIQCMMLKQL